jgi:hypothetical protein
MPVWVMIPPVAASPKAWVSLVELAPEESRLRSRRSPRWIDPQALHRREIDHEPAVTHRGAGDVVAAASHGDERSRSRAKRTAARTSAAPVQRATSPG